MNIIENAQQGSAVWLAIRAQYDTASEAPAACGVSKYTSRSDLLKQKSTGLIPEVGHTKQALFDRGHQSEASARSLAEAIIGTELFPVTATFSVDGLDLLASMDGATMDETIIWEHKLFSEKLAADVRAGTLEPHYTIQMDQQLLVSGAKKCLFMTSDGTEANMAWCWYEYDQAKADALLAGWKQFRADLANYATAEIKEMPKAEVTVSLPALFIHAKGEITTSNMKEYGAALTARLEAVRAIKLITDQDFSNAKESAKLLRENIEQAKLAKEAMLAQTVTVGEAARMIDAWCEDMRLTALQLEKDVDREDKAKKEAMVSKTKGLYEAHILALNTEIAPLRMPITAPAFAEAIKNKRNYTSMQDALDTALANGKITADEMAKQIRAKTAWYLVAAKGYETLFADMQALVQKPMDDFQLAVKTRVDAQVQKEEKLRQDAAAAALAKPAVHPEQRADELFDEAHPPISQPAPAANVVTMRSGGAPAAAPAPVSASAPAPTASAEGWQPAETMPKMPDQWIQVQEVNLYRFLPYKTNSTEYKRGKKGRWQRHNGYGFENSEPPVGQWRIGEEVATTEAA